MVKNRDKAIKTWLGGVCLVPIAFLNIPITTIIRVKEVNMMSIDGANVMMVNRRIISRVTIRSSGFSTRPIPNSNEGNGI
jgi:hypothetical protein